MAVTIVLPDGRGHVGHVESSSSCLHLIEIRLSEWIARASVVYPLCVANGRARSRDTLPVHCSFSFYFFDLETLKSVLVVLMTLLLYRKNHTKVYGEARSILALYTVRELRGKSHAEFQL